MEFGFRGQDDTAGTRARTRRPQPCRQLPRHLLWAQNIVTLRGGAADSIAGVHWIYKVHLFFGMTPFALFPFSRLVHVWSGFGALAYLARPFQVVRTRRRARRRPPTFAGGIAE